MTWQDEFNGTSLSSDWIHEIEMVLGDGGNNELQYYRQQNTTVENGYLTIRAKQENYGGFNYTSSRIKLREISFIPMVELILEPNFHMDKGFGQLYGC